MEGLPDFPAEEPDIEKVRAVFEKFDKDKNGTIEKQELADVIKKCDPDAWPDDKIQRVFAAMDKDSDMHISLDEFFAWVFKPDPNNSALDVQSFRKVVETVESMPAPAAEAAEDDWGEDEEEVVDLKLDLEIAPDADVGEEDAERKVMVRIKVPEVEHPELGPELARTKSGKVQRAAMDVCCVIDISGSMSSKATYEVDGVTKDDGLTYLDIVKHAVKAVIGILKPQDRFSLIAFDNRADILHALDHMTPEGKEAAIANLDKQRPRGGTNIWTGVLAGMEALRTPCKEEGWRQKAIMLLTDGRPGSRPPKGEVGEMKAYKEAHPDFSFQLNTFGFGYNLDSRLLLEMATEGTGTFAFIPDAIIVGTAFVNSVCNSLSTQTQNATLHLMAQGGAQFTEPVVGIGADMVTDASWGRVVNLGPLQFGQSREVAVPMRVPAGEEPYLQAVVVYPSPSGREAKSEAVGVTRAWSDDAKIALCRSKMVETGYTVVDACEVGKAAEAQKAMEELKSLMGSAFPSPEGAPNTFTTLKADVDGRMTKALDGMDRFNRWGKHYLRALTRAHQLQICTNFMDTGLQVYGGQLFQGLRDEGDAVFLSLPAPKPSAAPARAAPRAAAATGSSARTRSSSPDMSTYYAGGGGG
mmetsp:Transcript_2618/g.4803  ORF Transcript_2618/g.4803 Transcript_2618/m.4803 type:complete len:639 (-) Transcript_2618:83-1999(-)